MRTRLGTNQHKKQYRLLGLTRGGDLDIIKIMGALIIIELVFWTHTQVDKRLQHATDSLTWVKKAYAATPHPYIMPELAPMPERTRNIQLIRYYFGKDADAATKVFFCESGLRSEAMNTHNSDSFPDVGIAQIHVTNSQPFTVDEMKNPVANLLQAKRMFDTRGWQPWASSNGCHHMLGGGDN